MNKRLTHLDTIRGVAVMGILIMNSVSFGLSSAGYYDISAAGSTTKLDWFFGVFGEIFVDQKFMGIFSLLFGVSVLLFLDRAEAKGHSPVKLSLKRNFWLLIIGVAHSFIWEGDVLMSYALCSPLLLIARRWSAPTMITSGILIFAQSMILGWIVGQYVSDEAIKAIWTGQITTDEEVFVLCSLFVDIMCRALGMMLIGMGLYRSGVLTHPNLSAQYVRVSAFVILTGSLIVGLSVLWASSRQFTPSSIYLSNVPNGLMTIPMTLAYVALLTWWNQRHEGWLIKSIRSMGRMALTNYLSQTMISLTIIHLVPTSWVSRSTLWVMMIMIWGFQLWSSTLWLKHFRYGPLEWLWRCATYHRWEMLSVKSM